AVRARGERVGRRNHLVAGRDPGRDAQQVQSGGTRGDGRRVRSADALRDELLEPVDGRPEREPARAEHFQDELLLALPEVRPRERDRLHFLSHACSAAFAAGANSSHWLQRSLRPWTVSRYASWISWVTGPGGPIT